MKVIVLSLLFTTSTLLFAKAKQVEVAKVIKVRGKATILYPGNHDVVTLKEGSSVYLDSSILTYKSSFVRLRYLDNSVINIAPNSKLVLDKASIEKQNISVINLLMGRIRSHVKKENKKNGIKLQVKTRSAVMGVRGTEFEAIHYPTAKRSTFITYSGKVEIEKAKISPKQNQKQKQKPLLLEAGLASSVIQDSSAPVSKELINTEQFIALKKGSVLKPQNINSPITLNEKFLKNTGALVDTNSGIIIPSNKNQKSIGSFNTENGEYIAPKGLKLDKKFGFVNSTESEGTASQKAQDLNGLLLVNNQISSKNVKNLLDKNISTKDEYRYFISVAPTVEAYTFKGNQSSFSGSTYSELATQVNFKMHFSLSEKNTLYINPALKYSKFEDTTEVTTENNENIFLKFMLGNKYEIFNKLSIITEAGINDDMLISFYQKGSNSSYYSSFLRQSTPRINLGFQKEFNNFSFLASYIQKFESGSGNQKIQQSNGQYLKINYQINNLNIFTAYTSENIKSFYTTNSFKQLCLGVGLNF